VEGAVAGEAAGDTAGQQALLAARVKIGEQDGDGLTDDPAPVGRGTVAQQREPGSFQVKEFLGGQIDGDLLGVLFPAAGQAQIAIVRAGRSWTKQFSDPWKAYPP
jgi:hypothetical protein